jgi:hypothetical protein
VSPMTDLPITPPDTDRVRWASELIWSACGAVVAAHCQRSFQFAGLVARLEGLQPDLEVLFLGTVLHDLGLAAQLAGTDRFEMRGANHARKLLLETGMDPARVGNVWDIIALHASTAIAAHKSVETYVGNRGISLDVRGNGIERLNLADVGNVLAVWPRAGFTDAFAQILIDEVRAHPSSTRLSWMESIAVGSIPGFTPTNFLDVLHASSATFPADPSPETL